MSQRVAVKCVALRLPQSRTHRANRNTSLSKGTQLGGGSVAAIVRSANTREVGH